ncbi:SKP1/BTB/POZ domain-containing protein [Orpheovirus IHUMI-LCC2]|uniref:SKP1/BTB/POZ domain-containing protein n=1 Tax=Orpheovirus IHUMI-LCC2 TaxID=2023057 RepID=A0A2I2L502_9VIRU|nr:SKP1/BTB/POZ domain-containing protein [Orpheovirus IHUMI-LCC2]SNW62613.1 SKP1/BTB/POZ domain-containing protein [Orpheovirus IHUMI-LCC2]
MLHKKNLYNNETFSDIKIKCKGEDGHEKQWHAHKVILCKYSNVLYKKFTIDMKDKHEDTIYVDWEPSVTEFILKFLYGCEYINKDYSDMEWKMKLYGVTHYWEIQKICSHIESELKKSIKNDNVDEDSFISLCKDGMLYENIKDLVYKYIKRNFLKLSSELCVISLEDLISGLGRHDLAFVNKNAYQIYLKLKEWSRVHKGNYDKEEFIKAVKKFVYFKQFTVDQTFGVNMKKYCGKLKDIKSGVVPQIFPIPNFLPSLKPIAPGTLRPGSIPGFNNDIIPNLDIPTSYICKYIKNNGNRCPENTLEFDDYCDTHLKRVVGQKTCQNEKDGKRCGNNVKNIGYEYCGAHVNKRERKGLPVKSAFPRAQLSDKPKIGLVPDLTNPSRFIDVTRKLYLKRGLGGKLVYYAKRGSNDEELPIPTHIKHALLEEGFDIE